MAIISWESRRGLRDGFQVSNGIIYPLGFGDYSESLTSTKTVTVRRVKPLDPFKSPTSISHSRTSKTVTFGTRVQGTLSTSAPFTYWHSVGWPALKLQADADGVHSRIRSKVKSSNLNLAQSVAEYRQACSMFVGAARDVVSAFRNLRSGRSFASFVRILQQPRGRTERRIANRWLEYQYGLKPLISDIYGVTTELCSRVSDGIPRHVSSSKESTLGTHTKSNTGVGVTFNNYFEETCSYRVIGRYTIKNSSLKTMAQIGLTNPLLLAWELIPYSFVVDWLFPVGQFLSSLDSLVGVEDLFLVQSTKYKVTSITGEFGGGVIFKGETYDRSGLGSLSLPSLGYQPSSSKTAVLNGLALLSNFRTGR